MLDLLLEKDEAVSLLGPLRLLGHQDGLSVWGGFNDPEHIEESLDACRQLASTEGRITLICDDGDAEFHHAAKRQGDLATIARVIFVGGGKTATLAGLSSGSLAGTDGDLPHTVVAAMQILSSEDTLIILTRDARTLERLKRTVRTGYDWRASWDEPEFGEYHSGPRPADQLWQRL